MSVLARMTGIAVSTAIGIALAGCTTTGITPVDQAQAAPSTAAPSGDTGKGDPPCGYDVHKGKVYVTSLGKAHGTARVSLQSKRYSYISTNVGTKRIKRGQSITIKPSKRVKASRVTVDIVKGKLTKNEGHGKVWKCEAA